LIAFIVGTTAELIKIAPVYHELTARGRDAEIWYSGQHVDELAGTLGDLDLPTPHEWLVPVRGARNLARPVDVPRWAALVAITVLRNRQRLKQRLRADGTPPVILVHGDTFTCPIGALVGWRLRARVGHIEAGLRSGSLRHPFPEELNRRVATRLVRLHFPPTAIEAGNLRRSRGTVVITGANTIIDAVRYALDHPRPTSLELPPEYGLATLHRFEPVTREEMYRTALETLREYSTKLPIVYFCGASERERLEQYGLLDLFDETDFRIEEKLSYVAFLPILARAKFVVTDSGGLQEETAHLGIPCAVHRGRTERHDGEGQSVLVTGFDITKLREFLGDYEPYRAGGDADRFHPSRIIADALLAMGPAYPVRAGWLSSCSSRSM
jgi:UDP-N-acetylglucosamine 2-epimerase (non-hydrolysing)